MGNQRFLSNKGTYPCSAFGTAHPKYESYIILYDPYIISNIFVDDPRRLVQGLE